METNLYPISNLMQRSRLAHPDVLQTIENAGIRPIMIGKRAFYPHDALVAVMARRRWLDSDEGKREVAQRRLETLAAALKVRSANAAAKRAAKRAAKKNAPAPDAAPSEQAQGDPARVSRRLAALESRSNDIYSLTCTISRQVSELYELVESIKNDNKAQGKLSMAHIAALNDLIGHDDTPAEPRQ